MPKKTEKVERKNNRCNCPASRMVKGTVVVITQEEVAQGLMLYCGESTHSTAYTHLVKVISMEEGDAAASWHVPCAQVYAPEVFPWPYTVDWFNDTGQPER